MSNYYSKNEIKSELEKNLSSDRAILKAWENVKIQTKKDGSPFVVFSKNFSGCRCEGNRLGVYAHGDKCGYVSDYFYVGNYSNAENVTVENAKKLLMYRIRGLQEHISAAETDLRDLDRNFQAVAISYGRINSKAK